jgi:hypothetical protein
MTHEKLIPYQKFGSRLVFSRRQLITWVEKHTVAPSDPEDEVKDKLVKSAQKKLRNG